MKEIIKKYYEKHAAENLHPLSTEMKVYADIDGLTVMGIVDRIVLQKSDKVIGCVLSSIADIAKVEHLYKFGFAFCDLLLIVGYGMEIVAGWKDGCYHNIQFTEYDNI